MRIERREHALQATDSPQLASIIIRTQAQFIGSHDRLRAFAALLDDTVRFFNARLALLHEVDALADDAVATDPFPLLASSRLAEVGTERAPSAAHLQLLMQVVSGRQAALAGPGFSTTTAASGSVMVLPIQRDGEVIGVLTLVHDVGDFSLDDADTAQPICALLAQLLEVWQTTRRRRQDQQSIARLSQVAQQMRNGIVITGSTGRIDWVNDAFLNEIGMTTDEVLGRTPAEICTHLALATDDAARLTGLLDEGTPFAGEFPLVDRRDGTQTWYEISGSPFINAAGVADGLLLMMVDVTERRRVERMKDDFITTISHELRTPLTSIRGALALLDAGAGGVLPTAVSEMVTIAHRNSGRLSRLIDDLLDLDKLSAGKLRIELALHDLQPLIDDALHEHQVYADAYGVHLSSSAVDERIFVNVDPQRFQQVMRNLLSNATKFSPPGSVVEVRVAATRRDVSVHVVDCGVGIPAAFQPEVFQRFAQAETNTGVRVGTGLGLAISRELVEGMQGHISFTSTEGVGSCFTVTLPRCEPQVTA